MIYHLLIKPIWMALYGNRRLQRIEDEWLRKQGLR